MRDCSEKKTLRARLVLPVSAPPLENGMVRIEHGRFVEVAPWDGSAATDLGEAILMPGFINAHCHLDYTVMRGAILPNASFAKWVQRINDLKRVLTDDAYVQSISDGFAELARHGTTTVLNIESFPELMVRLPQPPLRTWWFYELLDIRSRIHTEDVVAGALSFFDERPSWPGGFGLSPHAPYTTSASLYQLSRFCCEKYGMPFTTHLAESDEEIAMFREAAGPLHQFLARLGRNMSDTGGVTPVARLIGENALPDGAILAHMNLLDEQDWALLRGRNFSIVHCPCCHDYFRRPSFPMERFRAEGFNVCLGTDSLASNRALDLFSEMRMVRRKHSSLRDGEILDMVTRNGARAIGLPGQLGEISPGALADLMAIPYSGPSEAALSAILDFSANVPWMMVNGRELPPRQANG